MRTSTSSMYTQRHTNLKKRRKIQVLAKLYLSTFRTKVSLSTPILFTIHLPPQTRKHLELETDDQGQKIGCETWSKKWEIVKKKSFFSPICVPWNKISDCVNKSSCSLCPLRKRGFCESAWEAFSWGLEIWRWTNLKSFSLLFVRLTSNSFWCGSRIYIEILSEKWKASSRKR